MREMCVAGKPQIKPEHGEIGRAIGQMLERETQPQPILMAVQTHAGFAAKNARKMERRTEDRSGQSA